MPPCAQEHGLAFGPAHARTVEIDVHHQLVAATADQERLALDSQRHVRRIPAVRRSRNRFSPSWKPNRATGWNCPSAVLLEHDRIVGLDVAELGRKRQRGHHVVAVRGAARGDDAQVLVVDVVQQNGLLMRSLCSAVSAARAA